MIIAVFGDVHGQLDGMYQLCQWWEAAQGRRIGLVLQIGDLGVWRDDSALDRATRRFAERDASELGGRDYVEGRKDAPIFTVFIHGNHEDFDFLLSHRNEAVDYSGNLFYLGSGSTYTWESEGVGLRIAGLGGIHLRVPVRPHHYKYFGNRYIHANDVRRLMKLSPGNVDVLLTHDAPEGYGLADNPDTGCPAITRLIEHLQPRFAFWGHYHDPPRPFHIGRTLCVCMNQPNAVHIPDREGSMGILDLSDWSFRLVEPGDLTP